MNPDLGATPETLSPRHPPAPGPARSIPLIGRLRLGLAAALGIEPRGSTGRDRLDHGTLLAVERSYLAADRTLMAWIRTALSMISFGFTIGKLGQTVADIELQGGLRGPRMVSVESVAYFLVILGTSALLAALLQYLISVGEYAAMGLRHRVSISFVVGVVLVAVGGLAFTALVMQL
jgi:putative membrane protein